MNQYEKPELLAEFPAAVRIPVQWGDMDSFQHVNNVVYLRWFESARVEYLAVTGIDAIMERTHAGPILASIQCNYRRQLRYPDAIWVGARMLKMGGTSMRATHQIYSEQQQRVVAEGESGVVYFDYKNQRPMSIPEEVRSLIETAEGKTF
ncbi:MAG: thioesterase family protein [Pirellulaceae bacterium]